MIIHSKYGAITKTPYAESFSDLEKSTIIKKLKACIKITIKYKLITNQNRFKIPLSRAPWVDYQVVGIASKTGRGILVRVIGEEEDTFVEWGHYNAREWCDQMATHLHIELRKVFSKLKKTRKELKNLHPELEWHLITVW